MERFQSLKKRAVSLGLLSPEATDTTQTYSLMADNTIDWTEKYRPNVGGKQRDFTLTPFWIQPYTDTAFNKIILNGRQTYKSTFGTDMIASYVTRYPNIEATYVLDNEERLRSWSKQRLRQDTFLVNNILKQFLPHKQQAAVQEIKLINGSVIYIVTDERQYNKVEGKTNSILILDEAQKQDLEYLVISTYSLRTTKGPLILMGVGGESGSEWHRLWEDSTQYEWVYDDVTWRDNLTFDNTGTINNDKSQLQQILKGKWIAQGNEDSLYHGYHMPQTIFATIPITINSAINDYKTRPEDSIEYQKIHLPNSIFLSHTLGEFYKAKRRPITAEMVRACVDKSLTLLTGQQVKTLKSIHKSDLLVLQGIDWGSGEAASSTVGSIILYWVKSNRYQLAHIDINPCESELDEAPYFITKFHEYGVDYCVADMGYGANKVEFMQNGGIHPRTGIAYPPLSHGKVKGCWTGGNLTNEDINYKKQIDMEGVKKKDHISVEKSQIMQNFIDMLNTFESINNDTITTLLSQFILPDMDDILYRRIEKDFCAITRKDLNDDNEEIATEDDTRQKPKKEFNHPRDTVMSIIYTMIARTRYNPSAGTISPVKFKKRGR